MVAVPMQVTAVKVLCVKALLFECIEKPNIHHYSLAEVDYSDNMAVRHRNHFHQALFQYMRDLDCTDHPVR